MILQVGCVLSPIGIPFLLGGTQVTNLDWCVPYTKSESMLWSVLGPAEFAPSAAGVDDRVVADDIGCQSIFSLHSFEPLLGPVSVARLGTRVKHGAEAHNVGPGPLADLLEPVLSTIDVTCLGRAVSCKSLVTFKCFHQSYFVATC